MTEASKDYEWVRERLKREQKRPTPYTANRQHYLLTEAKKRNGEKGVNELKKEFKLGR